MTLHVNAVISVTCALGLVRIGTLDLIIRRTDTMIQLAAISFTSISVASKSITVTTWVRAQVSSVISGGAYGFHQWDITIRDFSKRQLVVSS